jgi:hypothetical protein
MESYYGIEKRYKWIKSTSGYFGCNFHFNPNSLTGGFIGVDIFFVISGFLMTSIIFKGLDSKQFSIVRFILLFSKGSCWRWRFYVGDNISGLFKLPLTKCLRKLNC